MITNNFLDIDLAEGFDGSSGSASTITEPISLADAKAHLYVDGTQDDSIITGLIPAARQTIEDYCHISLVEKLVTATLQVNNTPKYLFSNPLTFNSAYNIFELPYGPVDEIISVESVNQDNTISLLVEGEHYWVHGTKFKNLKILNSYFDLIIIYTVKYDNIPANLILAIKNEIAFRFENRGERTNRYQAQNVGLSEAAEYLAFKFRRMTWQ